MPPRHPDSRVRDTLDDIVRLLQTHRILQALTQRREGPQQALVEGLQHRQNLAELQKRLRELHVADIAHVLEALPPDDRTTVWAQVPDGRAGLVFVESSEALRDWFSRETPGPRLVRVLSTLDPQDLAFVADDVPRPTLDAVTMALEAGGRDTLAEATRYGEGSVGHHMAAHWVECPETALAGQVVQLLRDRGTLPPQTDRVFAVDARRVLKGTVSLQTLIVAGQADAVATLIDPSTPTFAPHDDVRSAARAFERYDLVSAPVVDDRGRIVGRLTVDAAMDVLRDDAESKALAQAGLRGGEDVFAAPWNSARNRWPWLGVNVVTALAASRVIGQFEDTIGRYAALAALMPIVASIGGNTGNQTMALVLRAVADEPLRGRRVWQVLRKELLVGLINGSIWGGMLGCLAAVLYGSASLGTVLCVAVVLNLTVAAATGVLVPVGLHAAGRDPAYGSSVLLTFVTDAMGFLLFLGLAHILL